MLYNLIFAVIMISTMWYTFVRPQAIDGWTWNRRYECISSLLVLLWVGWDIAGYLLMKRQTNHREMHKDFLVMTILVAIVWFLKFIPRRPLDSDEDASPAETDALDFQI